MAKSGRKNFRYPDEQLRADSKLAKNIATAVHAVAKQVGRRPSHSDLRDNNCGAIAGKLSARQIRMICEPLALSEPAPAVVWTRSRCEQAVRDVWAKLNRRPTHQDLRDHKHHRAVSLLSAADIGRIGRDANLPENRKRQAVGYWTKETIVEAYLEKFSHFDFGPRPYELLQIGEGGLKAIIERRFGSFREFEVVVRSRCPRMRFKEKPITANGIALDSFREVAVYEGMLLHLGVSADEIRAREIFPHGERRAFPDFIIRNVVIEVVMYASETESARSIEYFRNLKSKMAMYLDAGFEAIEIHPQDVVVAERRAKMIATIQAKLGTSLDPCTPGLTMREHGYWTTDNVRKEIAALATRLGRFPSFRDLDLHKIGSAKNPLIRYPRHVLAEELGYQLKKQSHGYWTEARVLKKCQALGGVTFPSRSLLEEHKTLLAAMKNSNHTMDDWRHLFDEKFLPACQ